MGTDALVIGSAVYYPRTFSKEIRTYLRLHFVDWRGFAEGGLAEFDRLLDDIEQQRQKLGLKKCLIIGHSAHALLALEYAKKYPHHISGVVMIGTYPNLSPENQALIARSWEESVWPERKAALELRKQEKVSDDPFINWYVSQDPKAWFDYNFNSAYLWEGVYINKPLFDYFYGKALADLDITRGLSHFSKPVFLAQGRFDFIATPLSVWEPLRSQFQDFTLRVFERSGHSPHMEEAPLFDAELKKWIDTKIAP